MAKLLPHPIFDTQVAAMVLGYGQIDQHDALVERITGHRPDKSHRFTDWSRRPLTKDQLDYAVSDVTHLRDVFAALDADLKKRGRSDWVSEEMEVLTSPRTYDIAPSRAWERLKTRVRKPKDLAVLMEVAAWREHEAQTRDVPRSRVLKDDAVGRRYRDPRPKRSIRKLAHLRFDAGRVPANVPSRATRSSMLSNAALPVIRKRCRSSSARATTPTSRRRWNCSRCCCA